MVDLPKRVAPKGRKVYVAAHMNGNRSATNVKLNPKVRKEIHDLLDEFIDHSNKANPGDSFRLVVLREGGYTPQETR